MNSYDTRLAMMEEQAHLTNEQALIGADMPDLQRHRTETALRLQAEQRRNNGRPDTPEMQRLQAASDAADEALAGAHARLKEIGERLAEIRLALGEPLALTPKQIAAHLKAVSDVRAKIANLEDAATAQAGTVAALAATPDTRAELAEKRAEILASLLTGEAKKSDLDRHDAESAGLLAAAESEAAALSDARGVAAVLARRLAESNQALDNLEPITHECRMSIIGNELTSSIIAHAEAETAWLGTTNRRIGLEYLLRQGGRNPPPMTRREPLPMQQAATAERVRLAAEHPDLFA